MGSHTAGGFSYTREKSQVGTNTESLIESFIIRLRLWNSPSQSRMSGFVDSYTVNLGPEVEFYNPTCNELVMNEDFLTFYAQFSALMIQELEIEGEKNHLNLNTKTN